MIMAGEHPKVPGTPANFEKDHQDKMKLNAAFEQFKELVEKEAKTSPDVRKLIVPMLRLERAIIIGAHGRHFIPVKQAKKQRS
jgi:hypothetical protein